MRGRCFDFDHAAASKASPVPARSAGQGAALGQRGDGRLHPAGEALLALQRHYGNHYVQRAVIQARLVVGPPGDRYEREADRVAHAVVRGTAGPGIRGVQAVGGSAAGLEPDDALQAQIQTASAGGRGQRIPGQVRAPLEEALGADFSHVRVHSDTRADQLSRSLRASALTAGSDIFFRRGTYAPGSPEGDALLTHELVHVLQQSGGPGPADVVQRNVPEDYDTYAEAKDANKYSRALLDKQQFDTLEDHVGKNFSAAEKTNIYRVNKGGTDQITDDDTGDALFLQDTKRTPHVDHRFPKSKGGSNSYTNAAVLPANVNIAKSDKLQELKSEPSTALPPYQGLVDPPGGVMAVKDFSADQKKEIYKANIKYYKKKRIVSDGDGKTRLARHDVTELPNIDHITPKSSGGSTFYFNAKVISMGENIRKGGERGGQSGEDKYDYDELQLTLKQYIDYKRTRVFPRGVMSPPPSPTSEEDTPPPKYKKRKLSEGGGSTKKKQRRSTGRGRSSSTGSKAEK